MRAAARCQTLALAITSIGQGSSWPSKIAIVTGADSGIGQAIVEEFAREGADIMIVYLHDRAGAGGTRDRVEATGRRAAVSHTDLRKEQSVAKLMKETHRLLASEDAD
jgi:NAD(P)-dependent dehydrogenase (short-subunit alcohol dehydrogenase family)